jgi:hypothetical protein
MCPAAMGGELQEKTTLFSWSTTVVTGCPIGRHGSVQKKAPHSRGFSFPSRRLFELFGGVG